MHAGQGLGKPLPGTNGHANLVSDMAMSHSPPTVKRILTSSFTTCSWLRSFGLM
jgi:hypothetical protein